MLEVLAQCAAFAYIALVSSPFALGARLPALVLGVPSLALTAALKAVPAVALAAAVLRTRVAPRFAAHARGMGAGLLLSALGDVLLDASGASPSPASPFFLGGLGAFLLAHVSYGRALYSTALRDDAAVAVACCLVNGGVLRMLVPHLLATPDGRALLAPVAAYMLAITAMLYASVVRSTAGARRGGAASWYASVAGAACFCVSDAALAWSMFAPPPRTDDGAVRWWWRAPKVVVMLTYYGAQLLLARGVTALAEGGEHVGGDDAPVALAAAARGGARRGKSPAPARGKVPPAPAAPPRGGSKPPPARGGGKATPPARSKSPVVRLGAGRPGAKTKAA